MTLHNLTCRHENKFNLIDINNIIRTNYFYMTKDSYYLSKYNTRQITNTLCYFLLNSIISIFIYLLKQY